MSQGRIRLHRWTKHGYDRLYVSVDGDDRGYVNLHTGHPKPKNGLAWTDDIGVEIGRWLRANGKANQACRWPTEVSSLAASAAGQQSPQPTTIGPPRTGPNTGRRVQTAPPPDRHTAPPPAPDRRTARDPIEGDLAANKAGAAVTAEARRRTTGWSRVARLLGFRTRDGAWRVGAKGERLVGRTLRVARWFGWKTVHAVPRGRGDIDHVVIGPGGVATINTKHHPGASVKAGHHVVFVRGRETDYARKATAEARFAADKLTAAAGHPIEVTPLLVMVGTVRVRGRRAAGVGVLPRRWLVPYLIARSIVGRPRLSRTDRDALYEVARRPSTWQ